MIRALYTAASGMSAQQMNLDTIANNLANSSTTGFRQLRLQFQDMVYQNMVTPGAAESQNHCRSRTADRSGNETGGDRGHQFPGRAERDRQSPRFGHSGRQASFRCSFPTARSAIRAPGSSSLNNQGTMVDVNGDPLIPTITIPTNATAVTITQYGVVNATLPGQQNPSQLGQIQLANFPNPGGLESMGNNLLQATLNSGDAVLENPGGGAGNGHATAGLPRKLQRRRGHRVRADGSGAARLRVELEGD